MVWGAPCRSTRSLCQDPVAGEPQRGPQLRLRAELSLHGEVVPGARACTACQGLEASPRSFEGCCTDSPLDDLSKQLAVGPGGGHRAEGSVSGEGQGKWSLFRDNCSRPLPTLLLSAPA